MTQREYMLQLEKDLDRYRQWVNDLQPGMYINCVYCGHRYGPDPGTPVTIADVLKAHIEVCPKYPLSTYRAASRRISAALTAYREALMEEHREH